MKTIQVRRTRHAGHCWSSRDELISDVLQWTPSHEKAKVGWPARTYMSIRDAVLKTCRKQLMIGRGGVRGSGISMLMVWHDDDDNSKCNISSCCSTGTDFSDFLLPFVSIIHRFRLDVTQVLVINSPVQCWSAQSSKSDSYIRNLLSPPVSRYGPPKSWIQIKKWLNPSLLDHGRYKK